ncbi:hypothetical protein ISN45_Aa06g032540 [Arabidopsis thaliana x Arabidopsis arenosa]|uniref:Uncharacterized protein n=1 Tax=Arabidopsis thaliana x Arabidopsis arenosa TaxID=1240361 RepID=A0A8T1Z1D6_9BRAS|nr:hypothetical protein ISN45_Aa06g032540 [Arabidopsis thaliana x Arabidopsis arenosa]
MAPKKSKKVRNESFIIEGEFGKYFSSELDDRKLALMKGGCGIPRQVKLIAPEPRESPESPPTGHCYAFEIFFSECGLSFPLPGLLVELMHELGIALPQLCPNVVRIVLCLQTLAEENGYRITLSDVFHLYTMKKGRTPGTFFLSPRSHFRVFGDFPEKDEKWRKSYFFFPVDEFTYGPNTGFFVRDWTRRPVKLPKIRVSHTFAEQFIRICNQSDLAWELFTCERIRNSCSRIYSRSDLITSSPPHTSPTIDRNMSPVSYREEKRLQKEREKVREAREKEDKARMVKALEEGKSRSASGKGKASGSVAPASESKTSDRRDRVKESSSKEIVRVSDSRSSRSSREKEYSDGGPTATSSRKRKSEDSDVLPLHRKIRSHTSVDVTPSEDAGTTSQGAKDISQGIPLSEPPVQVIVLPSRDSENRESGRQEIPIPTAPPKSPADFMRNFTPAGMRIPAFSELKEVNRANYFRFADKLGEIMLEYNTTFSCHESQLFPVNELDSLRTRVVELEEEIRQMKEMEEENARAVAKANEIRERMLEAEARCNHLDVANTDLSVKLKTGKNMYLEACDKITSLEAEAKRNEEWCKVVAEKRDEELAAARKDERRKLREHYSGLISKHETYLKALSENESISNRAAETRANQELLEELKRGEIPDIDAELESVKKDEADAEAKVNKMNALKPRPDEFAHLFVATPPESAPEDPYTEEELAIDEFGSNKNLMSELKTDQELEEKPKQDPEA